MSAANRNLELDIEDIDELPRAPRIPALAFVTVHKICGHAARSAMAVAVEEDRLAELTRLVRAMEPRDPTTRTLDGWARIGAVEGSLRGWLNVILTPPKDEPTPEHGAHYMSAGMVAWGVVSGVKAAMSKGVR